MAVRTWGCVIAQSAKVSPRNSFGATQMLCPKCGGIGNFSYEPVCDACDGKGSVISFVDGAAFEADILHLQQMRGEAAT
jgi:RecJ-like exonuclease